MRCATILFYGLLALALDSIELQAKPELEVDLSATTVELGQELVFKLQIEWPQGEANYTFAVPDLSLRNLKIESRGESQETFVQDDKERVLKTFSYTLKPLLKGEGKIYGFSISYIDPQLQLGGKLNIPEHSVLIKRSLFKNHGPAIIYWCIGLIIVLTGLTFFFMDQRKKQFQSCLVKKTREESYLDRLEKLEEARKRIPEKELLYELTRIWNQYLQERYQLKSSADARVSLEQLSVNEIGREDYAVIKGIFEHLSEGKYSGGNLRPSEWMDLEREIYKFIKGKQIVL